MSGGLELHSREARQRWHESRVSAEDGHAADRRWGGSLGLGGWPIQNRSWAWREKTNYDYEPRRLLQWVRLWTGTLLVVMLVGTGAVLLAIKYEGQQAPLEGAGHGRALQQEKPLGMGQPPASTDHVPPSSNLLVVHRKPQMVLERGEEDQPLSASQKEPQDETPSFAETREATSELRDEFEAWVAKHSKEYNSHHEKEKRFQIWVDNHYRTEEKNRRHGPCKVTGQQVFGSNHFKDLTSEEFRAQFLTGYDGPHHDLLGEQHRQMTLSDELMSQKGNSDDPRDARTAMKRHEHVQRRYLENWESSTLIRQNCGFMGDDGTGRCRMHDASSGVSGSSSSAFQYSGGCRWFDVSCLLRWVFSSLGISFSSPFDDGQYPDAVDWRDMGAVAGVNSQGSCGACWAITAVETVESAYYISHGTLYDLSEEEVILCDNTCMMCYGGWPQNAYDYIMEHNGLPLESQFGYDGDLMLVISMVLAGESDYFNVEDVEYYMESKCPADGGGSGDRNNGNYAGGSRYGQMKGYAYATDRCICYTDGTGCDCDEQNEWRAVKNVAKYGPATVCLEASTWQDYAGGIMTADGIGCSAAFLDMNHCVQAVGYVFTDGEETEEEEAQEAEGSGSKSHSNSHSKDGQSREGYWIVRNQWSQNWGINGYAYIAMGENTCGILNDMTQVFA